MAEDAKLKIGGLTIRIERDLCVGFGDCVTEAPDAFQLDDNDQAVFAADPAAVDREKLIKACELCPVDALTVWDEEGRQLIP